MTAGQTADGWQARLRHSTIYVYDRLVALGPHVIRLRPAPGTGGRVVAYSLRVTPKPVSLHWQLDAHGNWLARALFGARTGLLQLDVDLTLDMRPSNPFDFLVDPAAESWPWVYEPAVLRELSGSVAPMAGGRLLRDFVDGFRGRAPGGSVEALLTLNREIFERIEYTVRPTGEVQTPDETLAVGSGACRDMAWLLVEALRAFGVAARFVSGYLLPPPGGPDQRHQEEIEAGLHAWAAAYLPGAGWIELDPTSGTLCSESHLALAAANHYDGAAPVVGTSEPATVHTRFEFRTEYDGGG
jgi:transglutaminase-like putative cysteine protease